MRARRIALGRARRRRPFGGRLGVAILVGRRRLPCGCARCGVGRCHRRDTADRPGDAGRRRRHDRHPHRRRQVHQRSRAGTITARGIRVGHGWAQHRRRLIERFGRAERAERRVYFGVVLARFDRTHALVAGHRRARLGERGVAQVVIEIAVERAAKVVLILLADAVGLRRRFAAQRAQDAGFVIVRKPPTLHVRMKSVGRRRCGHWVGQAVFVRRGRAGRAIAACARKRIPVGRGVDRPIFRRRWRRWVELLVERARPTWRRRELGVVGLRRGVGGAGGSDRMLTHRAAPGGISGRPSRPTSYRS